ISRRWPACRPLDRLLRPTYRAAGARPGSALEGNRTPRGVGDLDGRDEGRVAVDEVTQGLDPAHGGAPRVPRLPVLRLLQNLLADVEERAQELRLRAVVDVAMLLDCALQDARKRVHI